jgi:hypothetical protein
VEITLPRFKLLPSMVTWAPPQTLCRSSGREGAVGGSHAVESGTRRRRRRGREVTLAGAGALPACTHEVAEVEYLPAPEGSKTAFLVKAAWSPGQLAARLLLPGACEFAGAVAQTRAFATLKGRLVEGAANSPSAAARSTANGAGKRAVHESIPASQL